MALIYRVVGLLDKYVPQRLQDVVEFGIVFRWNLNPSKNLPNISAVVPIVEQRDVPFRLHTQQELPERSWPFRKFKPEQSLVLHPLCTADHVSTVTLREFIVAYIVALLLGSSVRKRWTEMRWKRVCRTASGSR